jgi:murein L,D-transpeptidase YafK
MNMKIEIRKKTRTIKCLAQGHTVFTARVQLGFGANDGAKRAEGDGRTPEGAYLVSSKNPQSKFHLALGLSYPSAEDAARALRADAIGLAEFDRIATSPGHPPWDTALGGFIMIHGQPRDGKRDGDWTAGCVALPNAHMEMLYALARIGDEVVIYP